MAVLLSELADVLQKSSYVHSSLRLSAAALTTYFLLFNYDLPNCSVQPSESDQQTQQFCFKRVCCSFVGGFMAGQGNKSGAEEHGRQAAPPWSIWGAPVPRARPCCLSLVLPLYHPGAPCISKQSCCLPLVASCVKTTLCVGFREKPHPFQDKNPLGREFTSVHVISDYPKPSTVSWLLPWQCDTLLAHSKSQPSHLG